MTVDVSQSPERVVWIGGMPRSGTSWLAQLFASSPDARLKLCPLFSYEFKNELDWHSSVEDWRQLFRRVYVTESEYLDQGFLRSDGLVPVFADKAIEPTHLVIKSNRFHELVAHAVAIGVPARFLFIVRDPVSSIASWVLNPYEFPAEAQLEDQWRSGACRKTAAGEYWGFDDWVRVTRLHMALAADYPDMVRLVTYDDLLESVSETAASLLLWAGLSVHQQTIEFLEKSQTEHSTHPRSVYKNPRRAARLYEQLPVPIRREIEAELQGTELEPFLRHRLESSSDA